MGVGAKHSVMKLETSPRVRPRGGEARSGRAVAAVGGRCCRGPASAAAARVAAMDPNQKDYAPRPGGVFYNHSMHPNDANASMAMGGGGGEYGMAPAQAAHMVYSHEGQPMQVAYYQQGQMSMQMSSDMQQMQMMQMHQHFQQQQQQQQQLYQQQAQQQQQQAQMQHHNNMMAHTHHQQQQLMREYGASGNGSNSGSGSNTNNNERSPSGLPSPTTPASASQSPASAAVSAAGGPRRQPPAAAAGRGAGKPLDDTVTAAALSSLSLAGVATSQPPMIPTSAVSGVGSVLPSLSSEMLPSAQPPGGGAPVSAPVPLTTPPSLGNPTSVASATSAIAPAAAIAEQAAAGIIFGCTTTTYDECHALSMVGLPRKYLPLVKSIVSGHTLIFLFNFSDRQLHGTYIATSDGQENLSLTAWRGTAPTPKASNSLGMELDVDDGSPFPAQCTFEIVEEFAYAQPLRSAPPFLQTPPLLFSLLLFSRSLYASHLSARAYIQAGARGRVPPHSRVHREAALQVQALAMAVPRPPRDDVRV